MRVGEEKGVGGAGNRVEGVVGRGCERECTYLGRVGGRRHLGGDAGRVEGGGVTISTILACGCYAFLYDVFAINNLWLIRFTYMSSEELFWNTLYSMDRGVTDTLNMY